MFSGGRIALRQVVLGLLKDSMQCIKSDVLLLLEALLVTFEREGSVSDRVWVYGGVWDGEKEGNDMLLDGESVGWVFKVFEKFQLRSAENAKSWALAFCEYCY